MKTVRVVFGQEEVIMTGEAKSLAQYITFLKSVGWDVDEITKAEVVEDEG